jgi:murein DD-endopeptidase MepM/ murein hydrolase activator NlpD
VLRFPARSTASRRAQATLAALAAGALVVAVPAHADDLKDKKHKVEKKLKDADHEAEESSAALKAANSALAEAQSDLLDARNYLAQTRGELAAAEALDRLMQRRLDAAVARLLKAQQELVAGEAQVTEQEDDLRAMVVSSYEQGDPGLMGLSMVFTSGEPADIAGSMSASSSVVNKESAILDRLEATKVLLDVHRQEMEDAKDEVEKRRQEAAANLARKQSLELQAEAAESQVSQMVNLRAQARDAALKAKKADLVVLKNLIVERDRIADLIAEQASKGAGYTGPQTGNGFLDRPVDGPVTSPFGWRIHPIYGYRSLHDGTDFGVACGEPIRAAAGGKVLTEYYQTAYGNRIVIDHGVHLGVGVATISNHMSGYAVATGEHVKRGQVIGYVGNTGWSTGCHLHFTVLENGKAVDPMKWF